MTYSLVLYDADGASDSQRREAERLFRKVLEETLGDASLVAPVYAAYLRIIATMAKRPRRTR